MSKAVTDRLLSNLRNRGLDVTDLRGKLAPHRGGLRYGQVRGGAAGVTHIIQHWTGDSFSRNTIKAITGTDYGSNTIPDNMSRDDELDMIKWYHNYHQGLDGSSWPGLAYGIMVFPSGRVYVIWDIGTLTYHAFNANGVSYAISCPNSNWAPPTYPQLVALNHIWDLLCFHTPEIPAGHRNLIGHTEAKSIDSRNSTTCPGTFLPHVQQFRNTGKFTVEMPKAEQPIEVIYFKETGHFLSWGFRAFWEREGGLEKYGYPISEEFNRDGISSQWFQRARFEHQPDIAGNPWGVVLGLVGDEAAASDREVYPEAFARRSNE